MAIRTPSPVLFHLHQSMKALRSPSLIATKVKSLRSLLLVHNFQPLLFHQQQRRREETIASRLCGSSKSTRPTTNRCLSVSLKTMNHQQSNRFFSDHQRVRMALCHLMTLTRVVRNRHMSTSILHHCEKQKKRATGTLSSNNSFLFPNRLKRFVLSS